MSRLTGKEVYSLMEAYQAVYAPQELTEEQVWEGVENWVNSLLEEGYDLSDYTWEEMYENYLSENPNLISTALGAADKFANNTIGNISADVARKKTGNIPVVSDIAAEVGRSAGQGAYKDVKTNLGAGNIPGALKTASSALTMLKQNYEPDAFDYILEHLVDNGYADTNEAALAIMGNMSEDWRESIILEQTLPSNYTDYKAPAVQASHARSMGDASRMRQMGMNATSVDPEDDAQSNLNDVTSGSGVAKPLSGTTIRSGAGKGFKVGDPGIIIRPNN